MLQPVVDFVTSSFGQALALALVTALIGRAITARSKLVWAVSHRHWYQMPRLDDEGSFPVITQQVWFQNVGRLPAEDIEIVLNWKPQHFEVWPPRDYQTAILPDGRFALKVPYLAGNEIMTVSMIDTIREMPNIINVRTKAGLGKVVAMGPQRIWPLWAQYTMGALLLLGVTTLLYFVLQFSVQLFAIYRLTEGS